MNIRPKTQPCGTPKRAVLSEDTAAMDCQRKCEAIMPQQSWGTLLRDGKGEKKCNRLDKCQRNDFKMTKSWQVFLSFFLGDNGSDFSDEIRLNGRDETAIPFDGAAAIVFHFSKTFTVQTDLEERRKKGELWLRWQRDIIGLQSTSLPHPAPTHLFNIPRALLSPERVSEVQVHSCAELNAAPPPPNVSGCNHRGGGDGQRRLPSLLMSRVCAFRSLFKNSVQQNLAEMKNCRSFAVLLPRIRDQKELFHS